MKFSGTRSSHRILIIYGENTAYREAQEYLVDCFEKARERVDCVKVPNGNHGLANKGKELIRAWVEETFAKDL